MQWNANVFTLNKCKTAFNTHTDRRCFYLRSIEHEKFNSIIFLLWLNFYSKHYEKNAVSLSVIKYGIAVHLQCVNTIWISIRIEWETSFSHESSSFNWMKIHKNDENPSLFSCFIRCSCNVTNTSCYTVATNYNAYWFLYMMLFLLLFIHIKNNTPNLCNKILFPFQNSLPWVLLFDEFFFVMHRWQRKENSKTVLFLLSKPLIPLVR